MFLALNAWKQAMPRTRTFRKPKRIKNAILERFSDLQDPADANSRFQKSVPGRNSRSYFSGSIKVQHNNTIQLHVIKARNGPITSLVSTLARTKCDDILTNVLILQVLLNKAEKVIVNPVNDNHGTLIQIPIRLESLIAKGFPLSSNERGISVLPMINTPRAVITKNAGWEARTTIPSRFTYVHMMQPMTVSAISPKQIHPRYFKPCNKF
mmetsp:Transcript_36803/g.89351  ORF Transcript_36803/g.89351 Transcript_36803/m.89351 type:complete len:210 (+) Transcript_36803:2513-3142(+)